MTFLLVVLLATVMVSCNNDDQDMNKNLVGEYSFTMSGNVRIFTDGVADCNFKPVKAERGTLKVIKGKVGYYEAVFCSNDGNIFFCDIEDDRDCVYLRNGEKTACVDGVDYTLLFHGSLQRSSTGFYGELVCQGHKLNGFDTTVTSDKVNFIAERK